MPLITTSSCASSDENDGVFTGGTGAKDAANDKGTGGTTGSGGFPSGGTSGGGTGGSSGGATGGGGSGGMGGTATGGAGGTGGGGTCNPQTCPTPASPAVKCCITANGPCGVNYQQGAGCQAASTGDI